MLPLTPPIEPMLATAIDGIPRRDGLVFEPKWDGYRCIVFRDGASVELQSRSGKLLTRYFPEAVDMLLEALPQRCVLDGELVVTRGGRLSFDALNERVHPAASRIELLSRESPSSFIAFDLLAIDDTVLLEVPYRQRREALEEVLDVGTHVHRTPITDDPDVAAQWFDLFEGAGLDGLIAKPVDAPYQPGRRAMFKIKHARTADCVVAGFRWHKTGDVVGSLLLGLYDDHDVLHHVGVVGAFPAAQRAALVTELAPLREGAQDGHPWLPSAGSGAGSGADSGADSGLQRLPGAENRWRAGGLPWEPLRPERVVEVAYEHTEGGFPYRFRLNPRFVRWRPDRDPRSCRYDQLDEPARYDLDSVLRGEVRPARV
ncbi:MAG TPA: ATP-dependent DNA ligase [Pseudonocardiaceae bacterium]|jgi:ATP-dependent DNA ligase